MGKIQIIFFIFSILLCITVISLELGSSFSLSADNTNLDKYIENNKNNTTEVLTFPDYDYLPDLSIPGASIKVIGIIDLYLLLTMLFIGANYLINPSLITKSQGIITIIFCIPTILFSITNIVLLVAKVVLMISLLMAPIFGTIAYFAIYSGYDKSNTINFIKVLLILKFSLIISFLITNLKNISNIGLVTLLLTPIGLLWLMSLLFGLIPKFLLSIVDGIVAIIFLVVVLIWSISFLLNSIKSIKILLLK